MKGISTDILLYVSSRKMPPMPSGLKLESRMVKRAETNMPIQSSDALQYSVINLFVDSREWS